MNIELSKIRTSHNPRNPLPELSKALKQEGYEGYAPIQLVHELALSDDQFKRSEFVRLMEMYENYPRGLVELAVSRRALPLQDPVLRSFRTKVPPTEGATEAVYEERYGIVAGERRILAAAYNHVKHGDPAVILATVKKMTLAEALDAAIAENLQRKDMSEVEVGFAFRNGFEALKKVGQCRSFRDYCKLKGLDYQYARNRVGLTYLPENLRARVERGTLGVTKGALIGLEIKSRKRDAEGGLREGEEKCTNRRRAMTLAHLQVAFDEKKEHESKDYLRALAHAMNITYAAALRESNNRQREAA